MLPKKRRIEKREFRHIISRGKKLNGDNLLLYIAKIETDYELKDSRFSFSVSKKVTKGAVDRNRLRRVGYSVIEKSIERIKKGYFLFFVFKKNTVNVKFDVLEKEILKLLSEALVLE